MFGRRYITPMVFIFLCILANLAYAAKSVFVISSQDYSVVQAYRIYANHVTLQATAELPQNDDGAIALAAWPEKELLFVTYDFSPMIVWVSTKTLEKLGQLNTGATSYNGLGGSPIA
jgi:hypothetical protein